MFFPSPCDSVRSGLLSAPCRRAACPFLHLPPTQRHTACLCSGPAEADSRLSRWVVTRLNPNLCGPRPRGFSTGNYARQGRVSNDRNQITHRRRKVSFRHLNKSSAPSSSTSMMERGLKNCNSTVKAKQAVMDVAYYKWLKGSPAEVWVGIAVHGVLHGTCSRNSNVFTEYSECFGKEGKANRRVDSCALY